MPTSSFWAGYAPTGNFSWCATVLCSWSISSFSWNGIFHFWLKSGHVGGYSLSRCLRKLTWTEKLDAAVQKIWLICAKWLLPWSSWWLFIVTCWEVENSWMKYVWMKIVWSRVTNVPKFAFLRGLSSLPRTTIKKKPRGNPIMVNCVWLCRWTDTEYWPVNVNICVKL